MEYYISTFQDYLKTLCIKHKDIRHDDQTNVGLVRFQSNDDMNQLQNHAAANMVLVARYYGRASGANADDMKMKQFVQLRFVSAAIVDPQATSYADTITAAADKSFKIMLDFLTRMQLAQRDDNCGPLRGLELENANWAEIPEQPYLVNYYGWDLTLPFNSDFPAYDDLQWFPDPVLIGFDQPDLGLPVNVMNVAGDLLVIAAQTPDELIQAWNLDPVDAVLGQLSNPVQLPSGSWQFTFQGNPGQLAPAFVRVAQPGRHG